MSGQRILIVDDTAAVHDDFTRILAASDANAGQDLDALFASVVAPSTPPRQVRPTWLLDHATQGEDGVAAVRRAMEAGLPYAVAFVDMRMPPGWDGLRTIAAMWELDPALQVVICTAYSDHSWEEITTTIETRDRLLILRKPFDPVEVLQLATMLSAKWDLARLAEVRQRRLDGILERAPLAISVLAGDGTYRYANRSFTTLSSHATDQIIGRDDAALFGPDAAAASATWLRTLTSGTAIEQEGPDPRFNGRLTRRTAFTIPGDGDGDEVCILSDDLSLRRRLEGQLHQAAKLETLGRLAGGVAHDFNHLLAIILGHAQCIEACLTPTDPHRPALADIVMAATTAAGITEQLMSFLHKRSPQPVELELDAYLRSFITMVRRLVGPRVRVVLQTRAPGARVRIDPAQVGQVVLNLVINARDAMPDGGTVTVATAVADKDGERALALTISDTGVGMDQATLAHVFEPFFTTKPADQGTGLGLTTVRETLNTVGGRIGVESTPGKGTCFTVHLPRLSGSTRIPNQTPQRRPRRRILVVEDSISLRSLIHATLSTEGHQVRHTGDRDEAEAILHSAEPFDLLMTDLHLEGGDNTYDRLHAIRPALPVICVTGAPHEVPPGVPLVTKPFKLLDLVRAVELAL